MDENWKLEVRGGKREVKSGSSGVGSQVGDKGLRSE